MFLSDRYHFEHNGTCDGVDPYASTSKVCSYQTDIILNTTVYVLQVLRFFPRRFLHVLCYPAQMFSPGTPFLAQTFSTCNVLSCSDVFSMYCSFLLRCFLQVLRFLLRCFLHVLCFPAQMCSPRTVLFCSDVFSMYCSFLLRCYLQVPRFLLRCFLQEFRFFHH